MESPDSAPEAPARPSRAVRERGLWLALGVLIALVAALAVPFSLHRGILLVIALLVLARLIAPWRWLRALAGALAVTLMLLLASLMALVGVPYIAVSAPSPDGEVVAELVEIGWLVDRHFIVRLTRYRLGFVPVSDEIFDSPDEGAWGGERFLWSGDGRHLLLLGTQLFATPEACLATGEALYLLVDRITGTLRSNATQTREPRFSLEDLAGMNFGVPLARGSPTWHEGRRRCVPPVWP